MSTSPQPKHITLPKELVAKYCPGGGQAMIKDSPHSLYFRTGPEVSNQIREFLMSRGWYDLSYAQLHPLDFPTMILPDLMESISFSLRKFSPQQRVMMLKSLQQQMTTELKEFLHSQTDPITNQKPVLMNKRAVTYPRNNSYYKAVPSIWNIWWEDQGFNPINVPLLTSIRSWNHIFSFSAMFRKDGLQNEMMKFYSIFGESFAGVIPKGWVLPTESKSWNAYLLHLLQNDPQISVVVVKDDGEIDESVEQLANSATDLQFAQPRTKLYTSYNTDGMLQCSHTHPRQQSIQENGSESTQSLQQTSPTPSNPITSAPDLPQDIHTQQQLPQLTSNPQEQQLPNTFPPSITNKHAWIAKPSGGARGEGIFVFNDLHQLNTKIGILTKKKSEMTGSFRILGNKALPPSSETTSPPTTLPTSSDPTTSLPNQSITQSSTTATAGAKAPIKNAITPGGKLFTGTLTVQEYINTNMLVGTPKHKFDLRLYVLIVSHYPLEIYIHHMGIVRIAGMPFEEDITNTHAHLTNFSVGKHIKKTDKRSVNLQSSERSDENEAEKRASDETAPSTQSPNPAQSSIPSPSVSTSSPNSDSEPSQNTSTRADRRYDTLDSDNFDPTTFYSDGLKWTLDEFQSYIAQRKAECDTKGLRMKSWDQIWLDIKHLVLKALLPTVHTQFYSRGKGPFDQLQPTFQPQSQPQESSRPTSASSSPPTTPTSSTRTVWDDLFHTALNDTNPNYRGYELLGIDVMLHDDGSPILIEMNRSPAMVVQTPADLAKTQILHDIFNMLKVEASMLAQKRVKCADGSLHQGNSDDNSKEQQNVHLLDIQGVQVPFRWKNDISCFWLKYRPDCQLISDYCPFDEKLHLNDDNQGHTDSNERNQDQDESNKFALTEEICRDYCDTAYRRFSTLQQNMPQKIKKMLNSNNYNRHLQLSKQTTTPLSPESIHAPTQGQEDNQDGTLQTFSSSSTSSSSTLQQFKYPFSQPHHFERIYPLNICNYVSNYGEYKQVALDAIQQRHDELATILIPLLSTPLDQLTIGQYQAYKEYQSIQYSICHVDQLVEYQLLQTVSPNHFSTTSPRPQIHPISHLNLDLLFNPNAHFDSRNLTPQCTILHRKNRQPSNSAPLLANIAHLILLTHQHSIYWYLRRSAPLPAPSPQYPTPATLQQLLQILPTLQSLPIALTQLDLQAAEISGFKLITAMTMDARIKESTHNINQYVYIIARYIIWFQQHLCPQTQGK